MDMARIKRDPKKVALAQAILEAYNPESVEDMNDALKDLFGPLFESMLQGEMNLIIKVLKKQKTKEMVIQRKLLKHPKVKLK